MMILSSSRRGYLLMELCIAISILGLMGGLTTFAFASVISRLQQVKEDIQMLFLARSEIEKWKGSGISRTEQEHCSSLHGYRVSLKRGISAIPGYEEATVRVTSAGGASFSITTGRFYETV